MYCTITQGTDALHDADTREAPWGTHHSIWFAIPAICLHMTPALQDRAALESAHYGIASNNIPSNNLIISCVTMLAALQSDDHGCEMNVTNGLSLLYLTIASVGKRSCLAPRELSEQAAAGGAADTAHKPCLRGGATVRTLAQVLRTQTRPQSNHT